MFRVDRLCGHLSPLLLPDVPLPTYTSLFEKQKLPASFPWDGPFCLASYHYEKCAPRNCGDGINVSFPFYIGGLQESICGYPGFELDCNNNGSSLIIQISRNDYSVGDINYTGKFPYMQLRNSPVTTCPLAIKNLTLDNYYGNFQLGSYGKVVFLMNCDISQLPNKNLTRYRIGSCDQLVMNGDDANLGIGMKVCTLMVVAPVEFEEDYSFEESDNMVDGGNYTEVMKLGFKLYWYGLDCSNCTLSGGRCGYYSFQLYCFCPNSDDTLPTVGCRTERIPVKEKPVKEEKPANLINKQRVISGEKKIVILVAALIVGVVMISVEVFLCFKKKLRQRQWRNQET
ncbi:concanavalin A-like lectin/glucanase [Tanacetum coccineum]